MPKSAVIVTGGVSGTSIVTHEVGGSDNYEAVKLVWGDPDSAVPVTEKDGERLPCTTDYPAGLVDAKGRLRSSGTRTLFSSKLAFGKESLVWDEDETDTSGNAASTHSTTDLNVLLHVETDDQIIRQTKRRFAVHPGSSTMVSLACKLASVAGSGVINICGLYDGTNGYIFEQQGSTLNIATVKGGTKTRVAQSSWSLDNLDGDDDAGNPSGITFDVTDHQIYHIAVEWTGSVWFGVSINGAIRWVHRVDNANSGTVPNVAAGNLPIRFEAYTTATTVELSHVAASVVAEDVGDEDELGTTHYISTAGVHLDAPTADTLYAVIGIKLKSAYTESVVRAAMASFVSESDDDFGWVLMLDPTVAGTFTYSDVSDSAIQRALGGSSNTVTGGTPVAGGWSTHALACPYEIPKGETAYLGTDVDGTERELVLCVRPSATGTVDLDINAGLGVVEFL